MKHVVVCRLQHNDPKRDPCEVIRIIRDADGGEASNCSCCWTKDPDTGRAWLCVAGNDAKVKIYNIREGKLVRTLVGHGAVSVPWAGINDLVTSPTDPGIIASASEDTTVRIWSLAAVHERQPCVCLFGGEGHAWDLLSVAFHDTGRFILSSGHDQVINLWVLPELPKGHVDMPVVVHYPHFSSSEVHTHLVDCVAFFGDLVLSRACQDSCIVLWRIQGFSSENAVPTLAEAPTTYDPTKLTRSAFAPVLTKDCPAPFTRLLQFHTPECEQQFYMRFRMFHVPGKHPVLAFCNMRNRIMFWDMERLRGYADYAGKLDDPGPDQTVPLDKPRWLMVTKGRRSNKDKDRERERDKLDKDKDKLAVAVTVAVAAAGVCEATVSATPEPTNAAVAGGINAATRAEWYRKYDTTDSHRMIEAHRTVFLTEANFLGRQVAWSPEGDWCVVVGNMNRAVICQRWA